jgi:hypothetical protein
MTTHRLPTRATSRLVSVAATNRPIVAPSSARPSVPSLSESLSTIAGSRPAHEAQPMPLRKKTA